MTINLLLLLDNNKRITGTMRGGPLGRARRDEGRLREDKTLPRSVQVRVDSSSKEVRRRTEEKAVAEEEERGGTRGVRDLKC